MRRKKRAAAAALDVLADPHRRAILEFIAAGERPAGVIAQQLPISRPAVSRHLRLLKEAGLVGDVAVGTRRIYRLEPCGADAVRAYFDDLWGDATRRYKLAAENIEPVLPDR